MKHIKYKNDGFTLVELAIVLVVYSLAIIAVLRALSVYTITNGEDATEETLETAQNSLFQFQSINGRYPCPADPTLGPGDANYGIEDCSITPVDGYSEDAGGNEVVETDAVLIGAFPYRTILPLPDDNEFITTDNPVDAQGYPIIGIRGRDVNLTGKHKLDGWNNKLTYAVTRSLTNADTYDSDEGRVSIVDENDINLLDRHGGAHFALISHGEDGIGAFARSGERVSDCGNFATTPNPNPPPGFTAPIDQTENCLFSDGKFSNGLINTNNDNYYDDHVTFFTYKDNRFWNRTVNGSDDNVAYNTNDGNVGVGTNDAQADLHVVGDIEVSNSVLADRVCPESRSGDTGDPDTDVNPDDCMVAGNFVIENGPLVCPNPGEYVYAISVNEVLCTPISSIFDPTTWTNTTCPPGESIYGFNSVTGVLCRATPP